MIQSQTPEDDAVFQFIKECLEIVYIDVSANDICYAMV